MTMMMATATTTTMTTNRSFSFSSSRNNDNDSNRARSLKMMMTQNWKKSWNGNRSQLTAASTTLAASVGRRRGRQSDDERMTKTTKTARVLAAQSKNDTNTDTNSNNKNAFEEMSEERKRKYYLVGGKGGVGKTSLSASLAVKFAISGQHQTLIVSTDPAHSLSDSLAQDVSSGVPVLVEGTDGMLYAMEIDTTQASQEFSEFSKTADFTKGASDFMGSVGLSGISDSLKDLKLGELLDTPPPGLDEAIAIAKVVQFTKDEKYAKFTRIVFDTAPTGHTLRLLSLPEFLDKSIGKIVRLRQKLTSAGDLVKGLFGQQDQNQDAAVEKLENLKKRLQEVKDLFRNKETTEFVIATIPTVLGISESGRLLKSLREETVPCTRIVINQILNVDVEDFQAASEATTEAREKLERRRAQNSEEEEDEDVTDLMRESARLALAAKRAVNFVKIKEKDQRKAMEMLDEDPLLKSLQRIEAPLFDLEIRGVPALKYFADQVW